VIDFTIIPYVHIYCRLNTRCFSSELLNNTISYRRMNNDQVLHKAPLTEPNQFMLVAPHASVPIRVGPSRRHRRRSVRTHATTRNEDEDVRASLSSLDAVMGAAKKDEDDADADEAPTTSAPKTTTTREMTIPLDDEKLAVLSLEVPSASHRLVRATMRSPLGIVFEAREDGKIVAVEFFDQSELGPSGAGVKIGDILRATSAMIPEMQYPAFNVIGGGVGRPGFRRVMYEVGYGETLSDATFDQAMKAIGSNAKAGDYDVELVFERGT